MNKTVRVHKSHYDLRSHIRNGIWQPGWVIDESVTIKHAYKRPGYEGHIVEIYVDDNGNEYMQMIEPYGTGLVRYVRDDGSEWRTTMAGFTYYKNGKPFLQVVTA